MAPSSMVALHRHLQGVMEVTQLHLSCWPRKDLSQATVGGDGAAGAWG